MLNPQLMVSAYGCYIKRSTLALAFIADHWPAEEDIDV
jgi:hypothetical protein